MIKSFSTQQINVRRGDRWLLKDVNFTVSTGEVLRITGKNGSGKTSLIRVLSGLSLAESGDLLINNHKTKQSELAIDTSYIGHRDGNKLNLTAIENLRFHNDLLKINPKQKPLDDSNEKHIINTLNLLGILDKADTLTKHLSFGQKRRLSFARLLLVKRPIWILDEPFTGVDIDGKALLEKLCVEHIENDGILLITHHGELKNTSLKRRERELDLSLFTPSDQIN